MTFAAETVSERINGITNRKKNLLIFLPSRLYSAGIDLTWPAPRVVPLYKLDLGPFEVHSKGYDPSLRPGELGLCRRRSIGQGAVRPTLVCTPWIKLFSPARLGRRGIPRWEVIRLVYAAWFCSPIFPRQDRGTTHHRLDGQSSIIFCGLPPRLRRSPSRVTMPRQPHLQSVLGH